jgi:uncharacterized membrane protein YfcA
MSESFLGVPATSEWLFAAFVGASVAAAWIGIVAGAAGGLILIGLLAMVYPPSVFVPIHTFVQLGNGAGRTAMMWRYVLRGTLLPFGIGAVIGAAAGAKIFVALPTAILQGLLGVFMLLVTWMPNMGRVGSEGRRFGVLGFVATFVGVFVSATGVLVAPFVASASPDRRNHVSTLAALMTLVHVCKLAAFSVLGFAMWPYAPLIVAMIAGALAGNWLGGITLDRMKERDFRLIFKLVLTALALRLVWVAAKSQGWV